MLSNPHLKGRVFRIVSCNEQVRESNGRLLEMIMKAIELFNEGRRMIDERLKRYPDTPTAKARWVLIYIHFQIYSKAYETNEFL